MGSNTRLIKLVRMLNSFLLIYSILLVLGVTLAGFYLAYSGKSGLDLSTIDSHSPRYVSYLTKILDQWRVVRDVGLVATVLLFILILSIIYKTKSLPSNLGYTLLLVVLLLTSYPLGAVIVSSWFYFNPIK